MEKKNYYNVCKKMEFLNHLFLLTEILKMTHMGLFMIMVHFM